MKAIEFPEVNLRIAEKQEEYQTLPVQQNTIMATNKETGETYPATYESIMCFQLEEEELKQVKETGCIWLKVYRPFMTSFPPLGMNLLKPENFK